MGAERYRFGVFEVDAAAGELRKQGLRLKLNVQPFQVLTILLERAGQIVPREEISRALWPEGTFVDYEHGVNSAINRIREALGDSARNPRFLETVARRGYRFVAPVERIGASESAAVSIMGIHTSPPDESRLEPAVEIVSPELQQHPSASGLSESGWTLLASAEQLPRLPQRRVDMLFLAMQCMYLGFYVGALANLPEIADLLGGLPHGTEWYVTVAVTAAVLIPVRVFLLTAVSMRAPGLQRRYLRLWPFVLPFDLLWALAPFLLLHHISAGLAMACVAPLVYSPFAQRSLILMGAGATRSMQDPPVD